MSRRSFDAAAQTARWISAGLFTLLVLAAPWAYGGVEQWFRSLAAGVLGMSVLCAGLTLVLSPGVTGPVKRSGSLVFLPVATLLLLGGSQLFAGQIPVDSPGDFGTIDPAATRLAVASVLATFAATALGAVVFSERSAFHGLLAVCLVSAATVAFLGIAMRLTGDDRIIRGLPVVGDPFARFVNRNNGAGFLIVGIAAGLGLLRSAMRPGPADEMRTVLSAGWGTIDRGTMFAAVMTLLALCLAGSVASRSRGGMIAAAVAVVAGTVFLVPKGRGLLRGVTLVPVVILAGALVVWLGLSEPAIERFRSISLDVALTESRVAHWRDVVPAVAARPVGGAGLGTYGHAYQQFSNESTDRWFEHADNQFVELAVEAGIVGVAALVGGIVLTVAGLWRGGPQPVERVAVASLVAGQLSHAVFDYAIIVPAVSLAAAALWGAGTARLFNNTHEDPPLSFVPSLSFVRTGSAAVLIILLTGGLAWSAIEHRAAWAVDHFVAAAAQAESAPEFDADRADRILQGLEVSLRGRPDDARGHRAAAGLYIARYRHEASRRLRSIDSTLSVETARDTTGLVSLHGAVCQLHRSGAEIGIAALRRDLFVERDLAPAARHYAAAASACSRTPNVWLPRAALTFLDAKADPRGIDRIKTAVELFPAEAGVQRTAGRMAWQAGDAELAARSWHRAFFLSSDGYWDLLAELAGQVGPAEAVRLGTPADVDAMMRPVQTLSMQAGDEVAADDALRKAFGSALAVAAERVPDGGNRRRALADAAWLTGDLEQAADRFRQAIVASPFDVELRVDHAGYLWATGRRSDSLDELRLAVALAPRRHQLQRLLELRLRDDSHQTLPIGN